MITVINGPKSFRAMVSYNEKKIEKGQGVRLLNTTLGEDRKGIIQDFQYQSTLNKRIRKSPAKELIITLNKQDRRISDQEFVQIGQRYLKEMGYEDVPFVMYWHADTEHQHMHIVTTRVKNDGRLVDEFRERFRSMAIDRQFEKDFGLKVTEYKMEKERKLQKELNAGKYSIQNALKKGIPDPVYELLGEKIRDKIACNSAMTNNEIKHELEKQDRLKDYESLMDYLDSNKLIYRMHKDRLTDTLYFVKQVSNSSEEYFRKLRLNKIYYRILTKPEGEQIVYGIKDVFYYKKVPRQFQLDQIRALDHPEKKNEHSREQQKRFVKNTVSKTLKESYSLEGLVEKLKAKGIKAQLYGKPGAPSGIAFTNKTIEGGERFKASELDRDLSFKHLQEKLKKGYLEREYFEEYGYMPGGDPFNSKSKKHHRSKSGDPDYQMDLREIKMKIEKNQQYMPHHARQAFDWRSLQYFMKGFARGLDEYDSEEQTDRLKRKGKGMGF